MPDVKFAELKAQVSVLQIAQLLGIGDLKQSIKNQAEYRAKCPTCNTPRVLVLTVGKGWYCHGCKTGGDIIKMVATYRHLEARDAALLIQESFGNSTAPSRTVHRATVTPDKGNTDRTAMLQKVLERIQPEHDAVQALGISPETAKAFESGFDSGGVLKGRYLIAVRSIQGELVAFAGIAVNPDQSPRIAFSHFDPATTGDLFNQHRVADGTELMLFRSPLDLILAVENGAPIESVVAPLTESINPLQLSVLSSLMDQKQIESLWL